MEFIKKHTLFFLVGIVVAAGLLRFVNLGSNPPSLTWDEVAWGYNAYALSTDLRDELGMFFPIAYVESFGDFKPPLYAYLSILPIKIFGLTPFAVRFVSAFIGTASVLVTYILVRHIFYKSEHSMEYGLIAAALHAVSPWHIMLSRGAWEANLVPFFISLGVLFFLRAVQTNKWTLILSAVSFALSIYSFNSGRVVAPLLVLVLSLVFWKRLVTMKTVVALSAVAGLLIVLPAIPHLLSPEASLRFREVNLFSDISVIERINQEIANDNNSLFSRAIHHRFLTFTVEFLKHYFDHFNFNYLFITGDPNIKFSIPDMGLLYLWELPFVIIGVLLLFKKREAYWWIIFLILGVGIIPAATATDTPHALRIGVTIPAFMAMSSYGIVSALGYFRTMNVSGVMRHGAGTLFLTGIGINMAYFLHGYFVHYPQFSTRAWQYTYSESIAFVKDHENEFDEVVVTNRLGRPYVYYMFYMQIPPQTFREQAEISRESFGFVTVNKVGKYVFKEELHQGDWKQEGKRVLYINTPDEVEGSPKILKEFFEKDGSLTLVAYTYE